MNSSLERRFWTKVSKQGSDECWNWIGSRSQSGQGYGQLYYNGKLISATHVSWFIHKGKWPFFLMLHIPECNNKACVNPNHLYEGDKHDNVFDALKDGKIKKQFCKRGHALNDPNNLLPPPPAYPNRRQCKLCHRIANAKHDAKRRG